MPAAPSTPPSDINAMRDACAPRLLQSAVRTLSFLSIVTSGLWFLLWLLAPQSWWQSLRTLVCFESGLGILACIAALLAYAAGRSPARRWPQPLQRLAGSVATAVGLSSLLLPSIYEHIGAFAAIIGPYCGMSPFAASAVVATGAASILASFPTRQRLRDMAMALNIVIVAFCAGLLFVWLLSPATRGITPPDRLMKPASALSLMSINFTFLLRAPDSGLSRLLIDGSAAAQLSRRLFMGSFISVLLFGGAEALLRKVAAFTHEEQNTLLAGCAFSLFAGIFLLHTQVLRRLVYAQIERAEHLESTVEHSQKAVSRLHQERCHLWNILRATHGFSVIATDIKGTITTFSEGAEKLLGFKASDVIGKKNLLALHDPLEVEQRARELGIAPSFDVLRALPNLGKCEHRAWTYLGRRKQRVSVFVSITAILDAQGQTDGYLAMGRDTSGDRRLEQDRDGLLNIGQELLMVTGLDGRLQHVSPSFTKVLGYAESELLGQCFYTFVHPEDFDANRRQATNIRKGRFCQRFENRWRAKDGRYHWISWDATLSSDRGCVYGGGWDLTRERAHIAEINGLLASEQHLIGIVSHDLRNPLTAISMATQLLQRQRCKPEKVERRAQQILGATHRAERLIHSILDLTQARLGHGIGIDCKEGSLLELVQVVVDEVRLAYPSRRIDLQGENDLPLVAFDRDRMAQVLQNLVTNAIKYSPPDGSVTVSCRRNAENIELTVHNGGTPIAPTLLPEIFELLRRDESRKNPGGHSIGLGLFIVRQIVEAHGATIAVTSTAEKGTTFTIHFVTQPVAHLVSTTDKMSEATSFPSPVHDYGRVFPQA